MVDQRGRGVDKKAKVKGVGKSKTPSSSGSPKTSRGKLSYKDKYALETLPGKISQLEADIKSLDVQMSAGNLYVKDLDAFNALALQLAEKQKEHDGAEEKWLALEMLREEIEGA